MRSRLRSRIWSARTNISLGEHRTVHALGHIAVLETHARSTTLEIRLILADIFSLTIKGDQNKQKTSPDEELSIRVGSNHPMSYHRGRYGSFAGCRWESNGIGINLCLSQSETCPHSDKIVMWLRCCVPGRGLRATLSGPISDRGEDDMRGSFLGSSR